MRARSMCLCSLLSACDNRTKVHVLQHRRESQHAFNTVRLLRLGLRNIRVHDMPTDIGQGFAMPVGFPKTAGVLYPSKDSLDLEELPASVAPDTLVVIDGTWDQAHRMYRDNTWLRRLTPYRLSPSQPSRYRIRKEPRAECLSTLESTVMALRQLEPETEGFDALLEAFDVMNDRQVECIASNASATKRKKRQRLREMRAVPAPLWAEPERVVVVYGESALPFSHRHKQDRELAQWCAMRLVETQAIFSALVATQRPMPSGAFLHDLGWREADMQTALPLSDMREQWQRFLRPGDQIVAWNKSTLRMGRQHGLTGDDIVLKAVYGNTTKRNFGTLEDVIAHDALQAVADLPIPGRAAQRLANAHAAALHLGRWARARQSADRAAVG